MNLYALPAGAPFLDSIAAAWLSASGPDPGEAAVGLILLPTRRAARALAEAFFRRSGGRPLLLPRIAAFGALDEAPLALAGHLDLPPAVGRAERLAALTRLILAAGGAAGPGSGMPGRTDRAWALAAELARLQDEAERAGVDLRAALPGAVPAEYALHWQKTLIFLRIITETWPAWLSEQGLMNPVARQVALLAIQARAWAETPPPFPVWAAGSTGEIPAVAKLLKVIATLPEGRVVLPGLDRGMTEEDFAALALLHPEHADAGTAQLLAALGAQRADVRPFPALPGPAAEARATMLRRALLPAPLLGAWTDGAAVDDRALQGLWHLGAADQQEEAVAIALALRAALEIPGARAALVTPDRGLARRVAAELGRFWVVADDSAGEPLAETPPAVFLRLLAAAATAEFAPLPLLSLLKHPLFAAGMVPAAARKAARALEVGVLRGPGPPPGLAALGRAAARADCGSDLVRRLAAGAAPLERLAARTTVAPQALLAALVESAELLAATDREAGPARLWAFEEGEALATHLAELITALGELSPIPPAELPALLLESLAGAVVRSRRALRSAGERAAAERQAGEHPRIFIWGLLEARLQTAELVVLGGLTEGTWPAATDPGPWLSRPMREAIGLASAEEAVGRAARDFLGAALAAREIIFSAPARRDGAPVVPARWLVRFQAMLAGQGRELPAHPALAWARALDRPASPPMPARAPAPVPKPAERPRKLAVTEIATWLADPYAIYARHVLRLKPLPGVAEVADAADFGKIVHQGLAAFLDEYRGSWPADASERLAGTLSRALAEAGLPPHLLAWWAPRLPRIAAFVAKTEAERRAAGPPLALAVEQPGELTLAAPAGSFVLTGRADRIERRSDGRLAILDYKTGRAPTQAEMVSGRAPQLALLAAMAERGAFGAGLAGPVSELATWRLAGLAKPGEAEGLGAPEQISALAEAAFGGLERLVAGFDDPARPYLAQPHPGNLPPFSDYAALARVAEWAPGED